MDSNMATKSKENAERSTQSRRIRLLIILGLILVAGVAVWFLTRNTTLYTPNKEEIRVQVEAALGVASLPDDVVYSDVQDQGCDSRNSVGVATYIHCDFAAHRYYKGRGNLGDDLKKVDTAFTAAGWRREPYTSRTAEEIKQVLNGTLDQLICYYPKSSTSPAACLGTYEDPTHWSAAALWQLIRDHKINPLVDDEYLYGVEVQAGYWSCSNNSFFVQPCPSSPSKPK